MEYQFLSFSAKKLFANTYVLQLCVAVVDLSLQMVTWSNPIYSFLHKCDEIQPMILLEILRVFPEEMDTKVIRLGSNRRREIQDELNNCAALLNDYLVRKHPYFISYLLEFDFICYKNVIEGSINERFFVRNYIEGVKMFLFLGFGY